jgi:uncharacterized protein YyaL (SSP411 family)
VAVTMIASTPADWKRWGEETIEGIRRELYLPKTKLYREDNRSDTPSFNWPAGVMLSALNGAARLNAKFKPWLREYADAMHAAYWRDGAYDSVAFPKEPDRYYDDNAWVAIALVETSEILGDKSYLKWAEETVEYVLSGEDNKLGGGIYWREREKMSKNTCSNAPSAVACDLLYAATKKPKYKAAADRIYAWTKSRLLDPSNHLYWDNVGLSGKVDKTHWSYNTALMIRAGAHDPSISATSEAASSHWLDAKSTLIKDDMAFAHLLFEALHPREGARLGIYLDGLHSKNMDSKGHYGKRWDDVAKAPRKTFRLIDQASAARAYFVAARNTKP